MYLVIQVPNDAYAMWAAGDVLLEYMDAHDGRWPSSWDDLRSFHASAGNKPTMVGPFSEMESRIRIDFRFDPQAAAASIRETDQSPTFRVVRLRNGSLTSWSTQEPNQRIFDELKRRRFGQASTKKNP